MYSNCSDQSSDQGVSSSGIYSEGCSKGRAVDFDCKIFLQEVSCMDKKRKKRQQIKEACRQHRQRIKALSQPRRVFRDLEPAKCLGKPLAELIPRLSELARPKRCTPKFVRPKSEEFCLPGAISDWGAHKKWAADRAQPKKDFAKLLHELREQKNCSVITCEGMKRIEKLAKPLSRQRRCIARPSTRTYHSKCIGYATDRILKLSKPKSQVEQNNDFRSLSNVLKVTKSAMTYEASERIKHLAIPSTRYLQCEKNNNDSLSLKSFSCHENLRLNSRSSAVRELISA